MILGAVLAGGLSTRFGSDKAAARWDGRPLIDHVIERMATIAGTIVVCGRQHAGTISIPDRPGAGLGPLGGLNAALHYAADHGFDFVVTAPCDTPRLDDCLLSRLVSVQSNAFLPALPVIGCWRSGDAALLDERLRNCDDRSLRSWARALGAEALDGPAPPNINFRADLETLEARP